jgi:L-iditol 2-dehydrogenase
LWVEASGSPQAFNAAIGQVRRGGRIVIVGMYAQSFEWMPTMAVRAGHSLFFSYASVSRDYHFALNLIAEGLIDTAPLANLFPLADAEEAFKAAMAGKTVKPVLVP